MRLLIFGTCSGTEPEPGRKHVSFAVEHRGGLYWFDAGEGCSYTAHLMGVDLLRVKKIFITHTHMDHVGGLGNLLWNIRKLDGIREQNGPRCGEPAGDIDLFIPDLRSWEGIRRMLLCTEGGFRCRFAINAAEYGDGVLCQSDGIKVTALHNRHLPRSEGEPWRSFGFAIEAGGKKVVYTGDTGGFEDYAPLLPGTDVLLHETGHHDPVRVAGAIASCAAPPKRLLFIHHGRRILDHCGEVAAGVRAILGERAAILEDATTVEV